MFAEQRAYMVDLLAQTQAAKSQGKSVEDAVKVVTAELQTKYPGWLRPGNATRAITMAYKESP